MVFSCASCDCHEAAPPGPADSSADVTVTPQPSSQILLEHSRPPACRQLEDAGGWRLGLEPGQPGTRARRKTEAPEETWAQSTEYLQAILWRGGEVPLPLLPRAHPGASPTKMQTTRILDQSPRPTVLQVRGRRQV